MVLKIASLVVLTACLVAAKDAEGPSKRQTSNTYLGSPQARQYLSGDAYQQHQARLSASFAQEQDDAAQAQIEAELHRDAVSNAKLAAESFKQSYSQSRGQQQLQQQQYQQPQVYAPSPSPHQAVQQTRAHQQPLVYAQNPAPQQHQVQVQQSQQPQQYQLQQQPQQHQQPIQALYRTAPAVQRIPSNQQASLQEYQARANLAEQAAVAFQEALQKGGRQQQRPRISNPQYILEQQHSFVVPDQTPEQFNLAAVQQAYQQIEQQQRSAADKIHSQSARPTAVLPTPAAPEVTYEEPSGYSLGDGPSDYEPARQRGQKKYNQSPVPQQETVEIKARRPTTVRSRPVATQAPKVAAAPSYQTEAIQAPITYEFAQAYKPETTQAPQNPTYQPAVEVPRAPVAPVRQPVQYPAQPAFLPTPSPPAPVTRVAAPARVAAATYTPRVPAPAVPLATAIPPRSVAASSPASSELVDGRLVNLDLNLLRSLYSAAETLAKKQKDEVGPITENDLIKALLEQGRREQQAAEILKKAAEKPQPEAPKVEVVRIPKAKGQQPITQEELQALISAGYDISPLEEEPSSSNADPIRQQYLRQAEFLERQALYKAQRGQPPRRV